MEKQVIDKLPKFKKGGILKNKKCSCGCDLKLTKKADGGIMETCSCKCGGKMKKHADGAKMDDKKPYSKSNYKGVYNKDLEGSTKAQRDSVSNAIKNNPDLTSDGNSENFKQVLQGIRTGKYKIKK